MTRDNAISVIMLIVKPAIHMKKKVEMTDVGSASAVISVDRQSHEDEDDEHRHQRAEHDRLADLCDVFFDVLGVVMDRADLQLWKGRCDAGERRVHARSAIAAVFAPDCFFTENDTASAPSSRVVEVRSSKPSTTRPTSLTRTVEPPSDRRMTRSISSTVSNSPLVRNEIVWAA